MSADRVLPPLAHPLQGVLPAVLTPLDAEMAPDGERLARRCQVLLAQKCTGLAVLGTTGEANSFSVEERLDLLEQLDAQGVPGRKLLPGTGCCAIPDTVRLTRRAVELGAMAVLMLPPFYYKSVSEDGLFAAYAEVIERVGDANLRICLYHFPQMSGIAIDPGLIERLLARFPATIVGVKDSSGDLAGMVATARRFPDLAVFSGSDELLLPLLEAGGAGCITACCNIAAPLALDVVRAWREGDHTLAVAAQAKLTEVRQLIAAYPMSAALKEVIAHVEGDPRWRAIRPPLMPLREAAARALWEGVQHLSLEIPATR
jgi:Dihydrodipicolinate synthase/N-acetylneuraminate lyase